MKKKILSWLLSASMLLSGAATMVSAADTAVEYGTLTGHRWYSGDGSYVATTEDSHSGKASVKMFGAHGKGSELLQSVSYDTSSQYIVSMYLKINNIGWKWMVSSYLGGQTTGEGKNVSHLNQTVEWTTEGPDENGWYHVYATYTPTSDGNFHILNNNGANDPTFWALLDDISVVKVGDETNTNLILNGGFEEYTAYTTAVTAKAGTDSITIDWTNPAIASTAMAMTVNDEAVDVSSAALAANATNSVTVDGLEPETEYEVVVTATNAFGPVSGTATVTTEAEEVVEPEDPEETAIVFGKPASWFYNGDVIWYPVTTEDSYTGNASFKVNGLRRTGATTATQLLQQVAYDTSSQYEITMYIKVTPNVNWKWMLSVWLGGLVASRGHVAESDYTWEATEKEGWYKVTATYAPTADGNFHIANNNGTGETSFCALIDDISVVKVGDETKTNIIKNGGFEEFTPTSLNITSTETANGQVIVSWTNPIIPATAITITANGEEIDTTGVALTQSTANTKVISGLENGTNYEIVVTATTAYGDYSATTTATPRDLQVGFASDWWQNANYLVTTEDSHSGVGSLKFTGSASGELLQKVAYDSTKQYKVSLWFKSMPNLGHRWLAKAWLGAESAIGTNGVQHLNDTGWTRPADATELDENGWGYYEATYYPGAPAGGEEYFHIKLNAANGSFVGYVDDLTVTEVGGDGTNLINNGDFESFTPSDIEITNFAFDDSQFTVTWTNPVVESSAISVTVDGVAQDVSSVSTVANATNTLTVSGLENGKAYDVVIKATTAYGEKSDSFTAKPRKVEYGVSAEGWGKSSIYYISTEDSYSGVGALKFEGKETGKELVQSVDYDPEKQYNVTLYAKFQPNQAHNWMGRAWLGNEATAATNKVPHLNETGWTITGPDANGWYKYESCYYPGADESEYFHIKSQATVSNFVALIDNISVTEVGGDGTNLLKNGDFEAYESFDNIAQDAYLFDPDYIFWTVYGSADYFKVYKVVDGERVLLGQTEDGTANYYMLDESAVDGDRYVVTSVVLGMETDGVEVYAGFDAEPIFGLGSIAEDGSILITEDVSEIKAGTIIAGIKAFNNTEVEANPEVYVALYNNGALVSIQKVAVGEVAGYIETPVEAAVSVTVPEIAEGDNYEIKVMTWEGLDPLCSAFELN